MRNQDGKGMRKTYGTTLEGNQAGRAAHESVVIRAVLREHVVDERMALRRAACKDDLSYAGQGALRLVQRRICRVLLQTRTQIPTHKKLDIPKHRTPTMQYAGQLAHGR